MAMRRSSLFAFSFYRHRPFPSEEAIDAEWRVVLSVFSVTYHIFTKLSFLSGRLSQPSFRP